jgi:hypothetical protein
MYWEGEGCGIVPLYSVLSFVFLFFSFFCGGGVCKATWHISIMVRVFVNQGVRPETKGMIAVWMDVARPLPFFLSSSARSILHFPHQYHVPTTKQIGKP